MSEPKLEVPAELRDLAEKTIDQAERAVHDCLYSNGYV